MLHVEVAKALGWRAWLERRGEYELAVCAAPGRREPWTSTRDKSARERYREVSLREAQNKGFYGSRWPDYDTDWDATGPLIEANGIAMARNRVGRWEAWQGAAEMAPPGCDRWGGGETPLVAVCNLVVILGRAGVLRKP